MPPINPILDVTDRMRLYTAEAEWNERLAQRSADEESRQHFRDKANYFWGLVTELKGA